MKRLHFLTLVGSFVLSVAIPVSVVADQVYHSERLDFWLTDAGAAAVPPHLELRSGQVVNIHPNGPVNGALERYMINGARAHTSYQVVIEAFDVGCEGQPSLQIPTATLETNGKGNAQGKAGFSRDDLIPFKGATFGVRWTLVDEEGILAYETDCTTVSID